jgi:hypothetical protein
MGSHDCDPSDECLVSRLNLKEVDAPRTCVECLSVTMKWKINGAGRYPRRDPSLLQEKNWDSIIIGGGRGSKTILENIPLSAVLARSRCAGSSSILTERCEVEEGVEKP